MNLYKNKVEKSDHEKQKATNREEPQREEKLRATGGGQEGAQQGNHKRGSGGHGSWRHRNMRRGRQKVDKRIKHAAVDALTPGGRNPSPAPAAPQTSPRLVAPTPSWCRARCAANLRMSRRPPPSSTAVIRLYAAAAAAAGQPPPLSVSPRSFLLCCDESFALLAWILSWVAAVMELNLKSRGDDSAQPQ